MVINMARANDYYYKGYDIMNKNKQEKMLMELQNPYGYNLESNARREIDYDFKATRINQDFVKNKEFLEKGK